MRFYWQAGTQLGRGTYLVPTLMAPDSLMPNLAKYPPEIAAKAAAANASLSKTFAEAIKIGVKVGFGTDSGVSKHGEREVWSRPKWNSHDPVKDYGLLGPFAVDQSLLPTQQTPAK